ncbi:MAG: XRE family transcriptional regulator [Sulfurimonas sp.]|jgi:hypothetical protein
MKEIFKIKLRKVSKECLTPIVSKINKTEFTKLVGMNYISITNWNGTNKVPPLVKSWLENYIEKMKFETVKRTLKDAGVCDEL